MNHHAHSQGSLAERGPGEHTPMRAQFDAFWRHYPRKVEKQRARRAWTARLRAGIDPIVLVAAAERYGQITRDSGTEARFVKHPATFLGPDELWKEFPPLTEGQRADETGWYPASRLNWQGD